MCCKQSHSACHHNAAYLLGGVGRGAFQRIALRRPGQHAPAAVEQRGLQLRRTEIDADERVHPHLTLAGP